MTNYEYNKDEIMEIVKNGGSLAINKDTEKLCVCQDILCDECLFDRSIAPCTSACRHNRKKWLNSEYKPVAPTITVDEKLLLSMLNRNAWIARDSKETGNSLFIYLAKPIKVRQISWAISEARNYAELVFDLKNPMFRDLTILNYDNINFDFIKWEDKEPWQVKDLLNLEVK